MKIEVAYALPHKQIILPIEVEAGITIEMSILRSGILSEFPEIDRAAFFTFDEAREKINVAQIAFLEETVKKANSPGFMHAEPAVVPDAKRPTGD
jgi:predicted NUDIX family NTP pyrophosphohydrolase